MTLPNRENQVVPEVEFRLRESGAWTSLRSPDLFRGKTIVLFALPGAFTPTCSSSHVPRYQQLAPVFHAHGVDEVVCLSVNDAFVMDAWQKEESADRIRFLPDGNGEFTTAMGMMVDKGDLGFGARSWRYSMLVRDGVIEKMFVEPEVEGDPYGVSDADTMLRYVAKDARVPPSIVLFTKPGCSFCIEAKRLLEEHGLEHEEVVSTQSMRLAVAGVGTTPQVFVDGEHLGGADELGTWLAGLSDETSARSDAA